VIALLGNVFSPYYAQARRQGTADPLQHCALNVAMYGVNGKRWAMTERGAPHLRRTASSLVIGPSALSWDGDVLTVDLAEVTVPMPSHLRGRVRVHPTGLTGRCLTLDVEGTHRWWPIAPCARVEVTFARPALRWSGHGYLDANAGDAPLEATFATWHWSRAHLREGAAILYDVARRDGTRQSIAIRADTSGNVQDFDAPVETALPRTRWRIARHTRADPGHAVRVERVLEDTPFYARSVISAQLLGEPIIAMHESLSLDRFRQRWVQLLLPFRMPRALR
jgi:carotenoid 1,2-hydratase